ncbi:MAG: 6-phosphofructokinase [Oligoflexia bacterium]|nr:6-phosphofructokinase [Oligoflexia bacterium]
METKGNFGIVVSGGPAPGINSLLASVVIEAQNLGYGVRGFKNGFKDVATGKADAVISLTIPDVVPHMSTGGSILGTSRFNPMGSEVHKENIFRTLRSNSIDKLVVIGGEGSAYLSHLISSTQSEVKVAHLPKTIDNDLELPNNFPSFGFETARAVGTRILHTIAVDARTTGRWFIITSMGRKSGALALGLGLAADATITLIPEEFEQNVAVESVVEKIYASIAKRLKTLDKNFGVALLAEGIIDKLDSSGVEELRDCPRDEIGRLRYAEIELSEIIATRLRKRCRANGLEIMISSKNLGYELRCHPPFSFDIEYTKFLGHGAVKYLLAGLSGIMVVREYDNLGYVTLDSMLDAQGKIRSRTVNLDSDLYQVARSFMIR